TLAAEESVPYGELARLIDQVYAKDLTKSLRQIQLDKLPSNVREKLEAASTALAGDDSPLHQLQIVSATMAMIRDNLPALATGQQRLALLDFSLALESAFFTAATTIESSLDAFTRRGQLALLASTLDALYGSGLINKRQHRAMADELTKIAGDAVTAAKYKQSLDYLSLMPSWGTQNLRLFFGEAMAKLSRLEPKTNLFIQDYLRGSPMFFYASVIDGLVRDVNQIIGVSNDLFGENVGAGLRSLNPGIAQGQLAMAAGRQTTELNKNGIYLLPETVSELPPVAGILTEGEGNPLSHVQLLARNLGIPNVGIDQSLLPKLKDFENKPVVLAVSPAGSVRLTEASDPWAAQFLSAQKQPEKTLITVDLEKLDLDNREFATLSELRATDSGRTVGPKAAKLGELKHFYPEAVAEGLAIPFGVFRQILDDTPHRSGVSLFEWMINSYSALASLPEELKAERTEIFRAELEATIAGATPGNDFVTKLRRKLEAVFGEDGSYGVFVRSDTNVEDLPGFTGAGLNLTVANVVGADNILKAISRVWASPFTARSFAWRQSLMDKPEHVYPAVLLMLSVDADKSGVLVTQDIETGSRDWLSVAVNEGVGGAVDGQSAESVRINLQTGETRLMAAATAPLRRQISLDGGVSKLPVSSKDSVLNEANIKQLIQFARELPDRFPAIVDAQGRSAPADIEFGFLNDELRLFQIRPFLDSHQAQGNALLQSLDAPLMRNAEKLVNLLEKPSPP
ncbi:MAG: PEP/pyruvate-binding domain-containing protein, partial [Gammaproteobacteria bacterium]